MFHSLKAEAQGSILSVVACQQLFCDSISLLLKEGLRVKDSVYTTIGLQKMEEISQWKCNAYSSSVRDKLNLDALSNRWKGYRKSVFSGKKNGIIFSVQTVCMRPSLISGLLNILVYNMWCHKCWGWGMALLCPVRSNLGNKIVLEIDEGFKAYFPSLPSLKYVFLGM